MKNLTLLLALIISIGVNAQITFNTGDSEFDSDLNAINTSAKLDMNAFKADLTATFGVTTKNLDYMISINMEPGEIYLALEISTAVSKPIESVIDTYEANRDKGWGYIAQQMGIKPGSPEFHALKGKSKAKKENVGKSYGNAGNATGNGNGNSSARKKK